MNTTSLTSRIGGLCRLILFWSATVNFIVSAPAQTSPPNQTTSDSDHVIAATQSQNTLSSPSPLASLPNASQLLRKLQTIIIPQVTFHDTTLQDAVESLRQEGHRFDSDPNPDNRGVNIFFRHPQPQQVQADHPQIAGLPSKTDAPLASASPATSPNQPTRVTATLRGVSLLEALRSVAKQTGLRIEVNRVSVEMVPASDPILMTAVFRVPPETLGYSPDPNPNWERDSAGDTNFIHPPDMKGWCEDKGVTFPPLTSAFYVPKSHKLFIRDSQENIDRLKRVLQLEPEIVSSTFVIP